MANRIPDSTLIDKYYVNGVVLGEEELNKPNIIFKTGINANYEDIKSLETANGDLEDKITVNEGGILTNASAITANANNISDLQDYDLSLGNAIGRNSDDITELYSTKAEKTAVIEGLELKVDKVEGKELSTNDYTDSEKLKVSDTAVLASENSDRLDAQDLSFIEVKESADALEERVDAFTETGAYDDTELRSLIENSSSLYSAVSSLSEVVVDYTTEEDFKKLIVEGYSYAEEAVDVNNKANDGDFYLGVGDYEADAGTVVHSDGKLILTGDGTNDRAYVTSERFEADTTGNELFVYTRVMTHSTDCEEMYISYRTGSGLETIANIEYPIADTWYDLYGSITLTDAYSSPYVTIREYYDTDAHALGKIMEIEKVYVVDKTVEGYLSKSDAEMIVMINGGSGDLVSTVDPIITVDNLDGTDTQTQQIIGTFRSNESIADTIDFVKGEITTRIDTDGSVLETPVVTDFINILRACAGTTKVSVDEIAYLDVECKIDSNDMLKGIEYSIDNIPVYDDSELRGLIGDKAALYYPTIYGNVAVESDQQYADLTVKSTSDTNSMTMVKFRDSNSDGYDLTYSKEFSNFAFNKVVNDAYVETQLSITDTDITYKGQSLITNDDRYYTETEVDTALSGKSDTGHTHDDRYYTETEVDTALSGKANSTHTHATSDVTGLDTALAGKSDTGHTHSYIGTGTTATSSVRGGLKVSVSGTTLTITN